MCGGVWVGVGPFWLAGLGSPPLWEGRGLLPSLDLLLLRPLPQESGPFPVSGPKVTLSGCSPHLARPTLARNVSWLLLKALGDTWASPWLWVLVSPHSEPQDKMINPFPQRQTEGQPQMDLGLDLIFSAL